MKEIIEREFHAYMSSLTLDDSKKSENIFRAVQRRAGKSLRDSIKHPNTAKKQSRACKFASCPWQLCAIETARSVRSPSRRAIAWFRVHRPKRVLVLANCDYDVGRGDCVAIRTDMIFFFAESYMCGVLS